MNGKEDNNESPRKRKRSEFESLFDNALSLAKSFTTLYCDRDARLYLREEDHKYLLDDRRAFMMGANESIDTLWLAPYDGERRLLAMTAEERQSVYGSSNVDICRHKANEPAKLGTSLHFAIEQHIKQQSSRTADALLWQRLPEWQQFLQAETQLAKEGWRFVRSEWAVFDEEFQMAGSIDALMARTTPSGDVEIMMVDFKRAKPLIKESKDTNCTRRMGRNAASDFCYAFRSNRDYFSHVGFVRYYLQLSIYAGILQRSYPDVGRRLTKMILLRMHNPAECYRQNAPPLPEIIPVPITQSLINNLFADRKKLLDLQIKIRDAPTSPMSMPDVKRYHELISTDGMPLNEFDIIQKTMSINAGTFF